MKRLKLKKYAAGRAVKEVLAQIYDPAKDGYFGPDGLYFAGWSGVIGPNSTITTDGWLYTDAIFHRRYSIENPDIDPGGIGLDMLPTKSPIYDFQQFGDFTFNLTDETAFGTEYATQTTPSVGLTEYYREPHEVVSYKPGRPGEIDLIFKNLSFDFGDSGVFGKVDDDGEIKLYANYIGGEVYSQPPTFKNSLPFAYLLEQPLNTNVVFSTPKNVYGVVTDEAETLVYSPNPGSGIHLNDVYSDVAEYPPDDLDKIYFNPFKLKNMYNYNWNMQYNRATLELTGIRDYQKVGASQGSLWLSYKYFGEDQGLIQHYDLVERIHGLYKYRPRADHKSNIYSIKIRNSGLNEGMPEGPEKDAIRSLIKTSIKTAVKKISPASTQLWKIMYEGL